nr:MAG TPA: hypothetical protein [Caudoviricetes sp.]
MALPCKLFLELLAGATLRILHTCLYSTGY